MFDPDRVSIKLNLIKIANKIHYTHAFIKIIA
jgi:hypothetical protein